MEYGTKGIRIESISLYQGHGASNVVHDDTLISAGPMGVVNQREADLVFFQRKVTVCVGVAIYIVLYRLKHFTEIILTIIVCLCCHILISLFIQTSHGTGCIVF